MQLFGRSIEKINVKHFSPVPGTQFFFFMLGCYYYSYNCQYNQPENMGVTENLMVTFEEVIKIQFFDQHGYCREVTQKKFFLLRNPGVLCLLVSHQRIVECSHLFSLSPVSSEDYCPDQVNLPRSSQSGWGPEMDIGPSAAPCRQKPTGTGLALQCFPQVWRVVLQGFTWSSHSHCLSEGRQSCRLQRTLEKENQTDNLSSLVPAFQPVSSVDSSGLSFQRVIHTRKPRSHMDIAA